MMIGVAFFSWWYGPGWRREAAAVGRGLAKLIDTFSIGLLLTSLFSPFRQISAGKVNGSFDVMVRAWLDRLVSRFIGALVRSAMIISGALVIASAALAGAVRLVVWPLLPLLPLLGLGLMLSGWVPWQK